MGASNFFRTAKNIFIIGGYGSRNIGDEAILAGIVESIRRENSSGKITVLSHCPQEVTKMHNVSAVGLYGILKEILFQDTIIIGGGTIFRENMRLRAQLIPLLAILLRAFQKRIIFYSLGIDANTSFLAKKLLVPVMNLSHFVSVRDKVSLNILKSWGVNVPIHIVPDPAIDLSYQKFTKLELSKFGVNPEKKVIGLSLRNLKKLNDLPFIHDLAKFLDKKIEDGYQVLYIPMCQSPITDFENDLLLGKKIQKTIKKKLNFIILTEQINPSKLKGIFSSLDLVIGMRLHAMILAISTKTPLLGIVYAQKCRSYLSSVNKSFLEINEVNIDSLNSLFSQWVKK
jgi:polysaccharide pyruvyl transferase CsaB